MKTKALSLTIAGFMAFQSAAFAATDRTAGIGDQAIAVAQTDMQQLKAQLASFDDALAEAEKGITEQDGAGNFSNGLTIGAAAVGLAVGGYAIYIAKQKSESAGMASLPFFVLAGASSAISSVSGLFTIARKSSGDVDEAQAELAKTQQLIEAARKQGMTAQEAQLMARLSSDLTETSAALGEYQKNGKALTRNRVISRVTQMGGTVILIASMVTSMKGVDGTLGQITGYGVLAGGIATAGGHLATILTGFQSYKAAPVLKEIRETREAIKNLSAQLN